MRKAQHDSMSPETHRLYTRTRKATAWISRAIRCRGMRIGWMSEGDRKEGKCEGYYPRAPGCLVRKRLPIDDTISIADRKEA
jgi:hypothetical protein